MQKVGYLIDTNNVESFQRIVYEAARARLDLPIHIYTVPGRPSQLALLIRPLPSQEEPHADQ